MGRKPEPIAPASPRMRMYRLKDGGVFAFAAMWERWTVREGTALAGSLPEFGSGVAIETCSILRTTASEVVAPVHDRMPVIRPRDAFAPWLSGETVEFGPHPIQAMTLYPMSILVNKPANDDARCIEPVGV